MGNVKRIGTCVLASLMLIASGCGPSAAEQKINSTAAKVDAAVEKASVVADNVGSVAGLLKTGVEIIAKKIVDEGMLQDWLAKARGSLHDPGIAVETAIVLRTTIKAEGVNGDIVMEAHGDSTRLPADTRANLLETLKGLDPSNPNHKPAYEMILKLLSQDRLEKNSVDEQHNRPLDPVPGGAAIPAATSWIPDARRGEVKPSRLHARLA